MTKVQFKHYYNNNFTALQNFAWQLTKNSVDAQDLVQETAFKAFKGMHTFKVGSSFKSWAFTILKNTFITNYNKKKKKGVVNAPIEDLTSAVEKRKFIQNDAISSMQMKEIENCIQKLSTKSKTPFLLFVKGYRYNEIATILNIPIGTVKSRINFARTKLKSIMSKRGLLK